MNDITPGTSVPPTIPSAFPASTPLGEHPDDRVPITGPVSAIEALLRQPRRALYQLRQAGGPGMIAGLFVVSAVCALVYGVIVGTFTGGAQLWIAPAKIAGGMLVCALICLPSLYI